MTSMHFFVWHVCYTDFCFHDFRLVNWILELGRVIHKNSVTYFSNPLNRIYVVGKNMVSIVICIIRHQKIYSLKFFPWNFHLCIEILHIEVYCSLFCLHFTSDGLFLLLFTSFDACVEWALLQFEDLFSSSIKQVWFGYALWTCSLFNKTCIIIHIWKMSNLLSEFWVMRIHVTLINWKSNVEVV